MRTEPPTACSPGKSSVAVLYPSTTTGAPRRTSPSGRKLPCATLNSCTAIMSRVDPITGMVRRRSPLATDSSATTTGAMRDTSGTERRMASTSSSVRSCGTPIAPGKNPVVSLRPGKTMMRLEPIEANCSVT